MSDEIKSLIQQAKSQTRKENLQKVLTHKMVIRGAVALVAIAIFWGIFGFVQNYREAKYSEILHQSLINQQLGNYEKTKENLKSIYEAKSAPSGVRSLGSLRYAGFLLSEGKKSEAAKVYVEINECFACDDYIKDLAGLLAVKVWMSDEEEVAKEDLASRIQKIENSANSLRYHISEQRGLLEMQKYNLEKSYQIFEAIAKSPEGSQVIKLRAEDEMKIVVSKGFAPKVESKKEEKETKKAE